MHARTLDPSFQSYAEGFLATKLDGVRILCGTPAAAWRVGPVAACLDADHIWLRDVPAYDNDRSTAILLHELCHIGQRRAGAREGGATSPHRLEAQANAIPRLLRRGAAMPRLLPAREAGPLHWGPAGHYYTVYVTALAAGLAPNVSFRYAFFSQIADQVGELDATDRGKDLLAGPAVTDAPDLQSGSWGRDFDVQKGLHALTGRVSFNESLARRKILVDAIVNHPNDDLRCGLAAHALGDSYAHRVMGNEAWMYGPGLGHAVEGPLFDKWHWPDFVNTRPVLYTAYIEDLYQAFQQAAGCRTNIPLAPLQEGCLIIAQKSTDETFQIGQLRLFSDVICGVTLSGFAPEMLPLRTWTYYAQYFHLMSKYSVNNALNLAKKWSDASLRL